MNTNTEPEKTTIVANPVWRKILFLAGWLFVFLALLGALLPLIPTTPFLLAAAACFSRSSGKFYKWLMENAIFGQYLRDYKAGNGIPLRVKVAALLFTWTSTILSAVFFIPWLWMKILVLSISAAISIHLAMIKTRK